MQKHLSKILRCDRQAGSKTREIDQKNIQTREEDQTDREEKKIRQTRERDQTERDR